MRTITPVPTAVTAFIGRAKRGPVNDPVVCNSFADFEQVFGGLWLDSALGFAVCDFFLNGGRQAVIVRIYHPAAPEEAGRATLAVGNLTLQARSPGVWGNAWLRGLRCPMHRSQNSWLIVTRLPQTPCFT